MVLNYGVSQISGGSRTTVGGYTVTREEAESRLRSQMDPAEKARRADVVIDTSGSIRYTRDSIPPLLAEERRLAALQRSNHGTDHPCAPQAR